MSDVKHRLAELTVSVFSSNVDSAGSVTQAARHILHIHSAVSELSTLSDELVTIDGSWFKNATKSLKSFHRKRGLLYQMFHIQVPMDPGTIEGKLS